MFNYTIQYPNLNYSAKYTPRSVRKSKLTTAEQIMVDITPLDRGDRVNYIPGDITQNVLAGAVWVAATLNLYTAKIVATTPVPVILGDTELGLAISCREVPTSLYATVEQLNKMVASFLLRFDLYRAATWDELLLGMMEGYSPLIGGTVYSSFLSAKDTGVVPMPKPGEDLLGGHIVNLVSFDRTQETGMAIGNLGMSFGNYGMLTFRGSYLRNLGICRDFFLLIPRKVEHAVH